MKKIILILIGLLAVCLIYFGFGRVSDKTEALIIERCDNFVQTYDYADTGLYDVENINYTINKIRKKGFGNEYFVDITWEIEFSNTCKKESAWSKDWLQKVNNVLLKDFVDPENGKRFTVTHTKKEYFDSVRVIVNGLDAYSGLDYHRELMGDRDETGVKCKSCGTSYQKGSANAKSISRTNMCEKCYNGYKSNSDALKNQPLD